MLDVREFPSRKSSSAPGPARLERRRLLLVDDDEGDLELTGSVLEKLTDEHFEIETARSYDQGLRRLLEGPFSLCLLDYRLDGKTGLEFVRELQERDCRVPVILLTGAGNPELARQILAAGATDYLEKTGLEANSLGRAIRYALERARATEALRERDRLFRAVFDAAKDAMLIADDAGRLVDGNPAALELLGVTRQQLLSRKTSDFEPKPSAASRRTGMTTGRVGELPAEWELERPDGQRRIVEGRASANILPGRHLTVLRDVTDRSRAEAVRNRLAAIVESAEDAIVGKDADGIIRQWNAGAERIFGCPANEAIGSPSERFVPADRQEEWRRMQGELRAGGRITHLETVRRRLDGSLIDVSVTGAPVTDLNGTIVGFSTITRDVTDAKQLTARLALADRMASVGLLAAGVAHEINNPLAAVISNVSTTLQDLDEALLSPQQGLPADTRNALRDALDCAQRVAHIVRDLKLLSRPEEHELKTSVEVSETLDAVCRMAANEVRHRARLVKDYLATSHAHANESRLAQVFLNLVVNAAQSIPEGNADRNEIRIATRSEGRTVVVEISDTGCGIPEERLARIFEPFFTTKPVGVGTGLGLSICSGIVGALGGDISVRSQVGHGSTFTVRLPAADLAPVDRAPGRMAPITFVRSLRVMVVDDEPVIIRSMARLLSPGHEVIGVENGLAALKLLETDRDFDLILCDLMMPEMTGIEVYERLRTLAPELMAKMVFVTGGAFTPSGREFLERFTGRVLEKPFELSQLMSIIRDVTGA